MDKARGAGSTWCARAELSGGADSETAREAARDRGQEGPNQWGQAQSANCGGRRQGKRIVHKRTIPQSPCAETQRNPKPKWAATPLRRLSSLSSLLKLPVMFYPRNLPSHLKISSAAVVYPNATMVKTPTAALPA